MDGGWFGGRKTPRNTLDFPSNTLELPPISSKFLRISSDLLDWSGREERSKSWWGKELSGGEGSG
jgi:hypothetical protein